MFVDPDEDMHQAEDFVLSVLHCSGVPTDREIGSPIIGLADFDPGVVANLANVSRVENLHNRSLEPEGVEIALQKIVVESLA